MNHLLHFCLLAAAGAAGTLLRAGCTTAATKLLGPSFPWGTLVVNVAGSFAFGAIYALTRSRMFTTDQEAVLLVGLLGGLTTYSSFAFQSVGMLESGRTAAALAYIAATNLLGLAGVWAGLRCCR
jgi:CrcB protein